MSKKPPVGYERDYPNISNMPAFEMAAHARELAHIASCSIMGFGAEDYADLEKAQQAEAKARVALAKTQPAYSFLGRLRVAAA